jgi:arylsulfatase A
MFLVHAPVQPTPDSERDSDHYGDMVRYMDKTVGRLVQTLEALSLRERTLILFTGDNGSARASELRGKPIKGGKGRMADQGTHVPLIANWPETTPAGKVCDDLVDFSDFLPTLAQAAGAPLPKDRVIDGYSFFPQLLGRKGRPREWAFVHHWKHGRKPEVQYQWIRDKRYKLYRVVRGSDAKVDGMLYDLSADPQEKRPLAAGKGGEAAEAARAKLAKLLEGIKEHKTPALPPLE